MNARRARARRPRASSRSRAFLLPYGSGTPGPRGPGKGPSPPSQAFSRVQVPSSTPGSPRAQRVLSLVSPPASRLHRCRRRGPTRAPEILRPPIRRLWAGAQPCPSHCAKM
ncbi:uncharacterized protein LOC108592918 [Callithrix jacchus]